MAGPLAASLGAELSAALDTLYLSLYTGLAELRLGPSGTRAPTRSVSVIGSYFPVVYCYDMRSMCGQSTAFGPCHMTAASCAALRGDDQGGQADTAKTRLGILIRMLIDSTPGTQLSGFYGCIYF